ncbi:hypothetical protein [Metasolibacillus meyeri]|uniref:hypothetical protein n=1 Tax=Metasolibacillus meyeri TaxID=1071052 RepID=UPI000D313F92|nr:hypothetical protein [Metasolibacillus meyeri]
MDFEKHVVFAELDQGTIEHIRKAAEIRGVDEWRIIINVLENYSERYMHLVESAKLAAERAATNIREGK